MDFILLLAVVPPLFLMHYVYKLDSIEREPPRLIIKLVLLGMASCIPAGIIESLLCGFLFGFIDPSSTLALLIENFLIIAMAEEGVKFWVTKRTWNDPAFNYRFDGVVYAVAAAIGFALLENIMYVFSSDGGELFTAIMRAITSIPGHCTFGVFMGLYYGEAKLAAVRGDEVLSRYMMKKAYHIPVLLHGFYDFVLSTEYDFMIIVFYVYIIVLYRYAKKRIQAAAMADEPLAPPQQTFFYNDRNPFF